MHASHELHDSLVSSFIDEPGHRGVFEILKFIAQMYVGNYRWVINLYCLLILDLILKEISITSCFRALILILLMFIVPA